MKLYKKEGNIIQILSSSNENAEKGDYLLVEDADVAKALIVQVIDVQFATIPGILEELLRTFPDGGEPIRGEDIDPLEIAPHMDLHPRRQLAHLQDSSNIGKRYADSQQFLASITVTIHNKKTVNSDAAQDCQS